MTHLLPEGITHIQYADDIVVMIEPSETNIRNLKIILYCFEYLSGLKINYHKSDLFWKELRGETKLGKYVELQFGKTPN